MVMHARKLPRLSDGYFDRNQAHPYQNSSTKYSKVGYNDRYNDKARDSPTNGSAYRNDSPEASRHSPRDRSYHNKASYSQRIKERERERDSKHEKDSGKEKTKVVVNRDHHHPSSHRNAESGSSKSEHQNNLDRSNSNEEKEKEKRLQVGDWSEHISSSGKKYYYNCKTEISQWEKPREWAEFERQQGKPYTDAGKFKDSVHDKHSSDRNARSMGHSQPSGSRPYDDRHHSKSSGGAAVSGSSSRSHSTSVDHVHRNMQQMQLKEERLSRQLERSEQRHQPGDPLRRDAERRTKNRKSSDDSQLQDMDISSDGTPPGTHSDSHSQNQTPVSFSNQQSSSGSSSLANLPKLLSQLTGNKCVPSNDKQELLTHEALQTLQTALYLTRQVTLAHPNVSSQSPHSALCAQSDMSPFPSQRSPVASSSHSQGLSHSVATGEQKLRSDEDRDRAGRSSPGSEYSHQSSRRDSPTSSICSLQGISTSGTTSLASASLRPTSTILTPSLANYFREDLIGHIMGWQADHAERQANKYGEDAHHIGSLTCTKVSADLKMSRSLVRVSEIQATVQEQRRLFLQQQIKELEEWKSQNSFMSDS